MVTRTQIVSILSCHKILLFFDAQSAATAREFRVREIEFNRNFSIKFRLFLTLTKGLKLKQIIFFQFRN